MSLLPPLLSESDQSALVLAAYDDRLTQQTVALGLHPASVLRTRAEVPAFAAALAAADDWQAMRLAESLRRLALEESTDLKVRVPLAKELLRQRKPDAWQKKPKRVAKAAKAATDHEADRVGKASGEANGATAATRGNGSFVGTDGDPLSMVVSRTKQSGVDRNGIAAATAEPTAKPRLIAESRGDEVGGGVCDRVGDEVRDGSDDGASVADKIGDRERLANVQSV